MSEKSVDRLEEELRALGYCTRRHASRKGEVVSIAYLVEVGAKRGEECRVGFSMGHEGYPDYPPHWLHVCPPVNDNVGGVVVDYSVDGVTWTYLSRPPGDDVWEDPRNRSAKTLLNDTVRRFWENV